MGRGERQSTAVLPDDLAAAIDEVPAARAAYDALGKTEQYLVMLPVLKAPTPAERSREITRAVSRLSG